MMKTNAVKSTTLLNNGKGIKYMAPNLDHIDFHQLLDYRILEAMNDNKKLLLINDIARAVMGKYPGLYEGEKVKGRIMGLANRDIIKRENNRGSDTHYSLPKKFNLRFHALEIGLEKAPDAKEGNTDMNATKSAPTTTNKSAGPVSKKPNPDMTIDPQEGIEVCIWKAMADRRPYSRSDVATLLEAVGIFPSTTMAKMYELNAKKKWFHRVPTPTDSTANSKTVYLVLKDEITRPLNGDPYTPNLSNRGEHTGGNVVKTGQQGAGLDDLEKAVEEQAAVQQSQEEIKEPMTHDQAMQAVAVAADQLTGGQFSHFLGKLPGATEGLRTVVDSVFHTDTPLDQHAGAVFTNQRVNPLARASVEVLGVELTLVDARLLGAELKANGFDKEPDQDNNCFIVQKYQILGNELDKATMHRLYIALIEIGVIQAA